MTGWFIGAILKVKKSGGEENVVVCTDVYNLCLGSCNNQIEWLDYSEFKHQRTTAIFDLIVAFDNISYSIEAMM